ncbi:MAG: hypothetical protein J6Z34_06175 [Clostridia bacterium]|nr:hypothetical protein [Clostridia bacterium]
MPILLAALPSGDAETSSALFLVRLPSSPDDLAKRYSAMTKLSIESPRY